MDICAAIIVSPEMMILDVSVGDAFERAVLPVFVLKI